MTTKTPWANLPNAEHIDAVLADVKARPEAWTSVWDAARGAVRTTAWNAMWFFKEAAIRAELEEAVRSAAQEVARVAARDAIFAFAVWDSSAELLDLPPDVLRTMIDLAPEPVCHQAALLLPYAIVREGV